MRRMIVSPVLSAFAVLALLVGVALIAVALWTRPLAEGLKAAQGGDLERAMERYAALEQRFDRVPLAKQLLPSVYRASIANQLQVQYHMGRFDAVIEKAASSLSTPSIHFWAGCSLFAKSRGVEKREDRVTWLNRAEEEFRKALEREPDDWDTKFNYEVTKHLLTELRQPKPQPPPQQFLPLLRPKPTIVDRPIRRVG
jgi:hypothetical protein